MCGSLCSSSNVDQAGPQIHRDLPASASQCWDYRWLPMPSLFVPCILQHGRAHLAPQDFLMQMSISESLLFLFLSSLNLAAFHFSLPDCFGKNLHGLVKTVECALSLIPEGKA